MSELCEARTGLKNSQRAGEDLVVARLHGVRCGEVKRSVVTSRVGRVTLDRLSLNKKRRVDFKWATKNSVRNRVDM